MNITLLYDLVAEHNASLTTLQNSLKILNTLERVLSYDDEGIKQFFPHANDIQGNFSENTDVNTYVNTKLFYEIRQSLKSLLTTIKLTHEKEIIQFILNVQNSYDELNSFLQKEDFRFKEVI